MASENSVMAVIRASRPTFRKDHDKVAFAIHASFLSAGFSLIAVGRRAVDNNPPIEGEEVGIEGWNELDDAYGFVYSKSEKDTKKAILVKCLPLEDYLMVDVVELKSEQKEPFHLQIDIIDYLADSGAQQTSYGNMYKNLQGLVKSLNTVILEQLEPKCKAMPSASSSRSSRFATSYLTLQSLLDVRQPLESMFTSTQWLNCAWGKKAEGKEIRRIILNDKFWATVTYAILSTRPLVQVIRLVDAEKKPAMGFICNAMDEAKELIAHNLGGEEANYREIWDIIDARWEVQLHRHLHAAAYYLNPQFQYSEKKSSNPEVKLGLYHCMERLIPDQNNREIADLQLVLFRNKEGFFWSSSSKSYNCQTISSIDKPWLGTNQGPVHGLPTHNEPMPSGLVYPPIAPYGGNDLYPGPGAGFFPERGSGMGGGMLVGPNDPRFFGPSGGLGSIGEPGSIGGIPGVPPGARFDPYGPPDVSGFEPQRFVRRPRWPGGGVHPDLEHFRGSDYI